MVTNMKTLNTSRFRSVFRAVAFNVIWLLTIQLAAYGQAIWATLPGLVYGIILLSQHNKSMRKYLIQWACLGLALGIISESIIIYNEVLGSVNHSNIGHPLWLLSLWIALFMLLPLELDKILNSPILAVSFGMIGGPFSYLSGAKLGAMKLIGSEIELICYTSILWGISMYTASFYWQRKKTVFLS